LNFDGKFREPKESSEEQHVELPVAASAGDIREIVRFLTRENSSFRIAELQNAEPRRVFEPHKLAAYEAWGIIVRDENYIRLSELGGELAKRNTFEKQIYRQILSNLPEYQSAVEWMSEQKLRIITFHDLADFWSANFPALLLGGKEMREVENAALSFFSICHAAELGIMTVGKRGQPTRVSVNADEVRKFLNKDYPPEIEIFQSAVGDNFAAKTEANQIPKVYISVGQRKGTDSLVELLELTGLKSLTAIDVSLENNFFSQTQISLMQKCSFGLFILDETHCRKQKNGSVELRNEKIIEINTALALFNGQIILLWDEEENPPQNIRNIQLSIFTKSDSEWETNLRIAKALKELLYKSN
jgi:soluble P-type ATPase